MFSKLFLLCCLVLYAEGGFEQDCGLEDIVSQPLVWNGNLVISRQFPWHVAIFRNDGPGDDDYKQICGGSLVRSQLVITAAHCFSMKEDNHTVDLSAYRVVGGSLHRSWTTENLEGRQQSEVRAVRLGENYGAHLRNFQDDIAIVHLRTEFIFSPVVRAVCLDLVDRELHDSQTSPGRMGKVAGWGLTESGNFPTELNFLRIPVVGKRQCYRQMQSNFKTHVTSDKICAGLTNGSAMCPGDSGGGLVFSLPDTISGLPRWYLRAVLSNAPLSDDPMNVLCQTKHVAMYSNIFSHRTWLSRNMEQLQPQTRCRARGSVGRCEEFNNCPAAKQDAFHGILPQKCSPSSTKICCLETCPPLPSSAIVSQRKTGSKAHDYCVDLPEKLYPCQQNGSSWSRGDLCGPNPERHKPQYYVARLTAASGSEKQRFGLVSAGRGITVHLISERWLLTRATAWDALLRLPALDITPPPEVIFSLNRTVRHPQYIPGNTIYDVGTNNIVLVEMDRPVPFSESYRPVCLHTAQDSLGVGGLTLTKWDVYGNRGPVTLLSQEECRRNFPPGSMGAASGVTDSHLCVTSSSSEVICGIRWKFLTASNGPRAGGCTQLLVGFVLHGKDDGSTCMELSLRVSSYIPWVESVVWP